ncbi:alpha-N-acetylgalactosaminide alpha-2,6-sialyltransferase 2 isoform X2 [Scyliorhinus canicula]|uniref:alpha-N-acetylgalactosaminide alpha-2,6-sialyltransferase 2 isoform X2 n=1 Tax=Scyliorhinus canicula TaxID=7830 RepID=UPI0018F28221|nr:alpha-N-acetylgalactosaminide alpha-2,6-sialyltransferase 2 isoform X2 [Scyliorhinus canicula]
MGRGSSCRGCFSLSLSTGQKVTAAAQLVNKAASLLTAPEVGYFLLDNRAAPSKLKETISETSSLKTNISSEEVRLVEFWVAVPSSGKNGSLLENVEMSTSAQIQTPPPFPGDRYATDDTYVHSKCPENLRDRLAKISEFKDVFLGTVPLLQWNKHATEQEYQRLSRYNGAHGWDVISYEDLKDALSYLNTSANTFMFDDWAERPNKDSGCIRCAVIGNGGILNGSRKGEEIDQHHYVFRANGAIIKGFEKDVGTRTSFYTFSTNTMMNSLNAYRRLGYIGLPQSKETRYIFLPDHNRDYYLVKAAITHTAVEKGNDKSNKPPMFFGESTGPGKFKMYHPDFIRYVRNRFLWSRILETSRRGIYRPSTGATMLLAAIHSCDEVSAYGFITENYAKYSDHYFDRDYHKLVFYANHDMRLEMKLWNKLHNYGIIKLYTREANASKVLR